jgi:hypothetical protein
MATFLSSRDAAFLSPELGPTACLFSYHTVVPGCPDHILILIRAPPLLGTGGTHEGNMSAMTLVPMHQHIISYGSRIV